MVYVVFLLSVFFALLGTYHAIQQILNTKKSKKWPDYGLELLFEPAENMSKAGLVHRNRTRLYLAFFVLTGLAYIALHKQQNMEGLLPF